MKKSKVINPLPFSVYLWTVVCLTVVGLAASTYLAQSHYRVYTDVGYKSFCAITRTINCDTVSQSAYSIFIGLPLAIWGFFGYAFVLMLQVFAGQKTAGKRRVWSVVFWTSFGFCCVSVALAIVSSLIIRSYCIMCLITYGINFSLLYFAWLIRRRFSSNGLLEDTKRDVLFFWDHRTRSVSLILIFLFVFGLMWSFLPAYWKFQPPQMLADMPSGINAAGHPWIGAENPLVEITEFSDYQCFQCKKMHFYLRHLIAQHPNKIRLVHRHYPMDHKFNPMVNEPFHLGAGKMALFAIYAASQGKFWEINDLLYNIDSTKKVINANELSKSVGLDENDMIKSINRMSTRYQLYYDIRAGNELGITGTPAYVVNDNLYIGNLPAEIIEKIFE